MPLSKYALDKFVAQDLSQLTECRAMSAIEKFPESNDWLSNFVLNSILRIPLPEDKAALAFALVRRAVGAIEDYEAARESLEIIAHGEKSVREYFKCLREFESVVAMLYQSFDYIRKALNIQLFTAGDGSVYEKLNQIYNRSRHADP